MSRDQYSHFSYPIRIVTLKEVCGLRPYRLDNANFKLVVVGKYFPAVELFWPIHANSLLQNYLQLTDFTIMKFQFVNQTGK